MPKVVFHFNTILFENSVANIIHTFFPLMKSQIKRLSVRKYKLIIHFFFAVKHLNLHHRFMDYCCDKSKSV